MAKKRTKADRLQRQTEQLGKKADRHPDEIEKKKTTREDGRDLAEVLAKTELPEETARGWRSDLQAARQGLKPPANKGR
jgi:hypothetical protein